MHIANNKAGLYVYLTDTERESFAKSGTTSRVFVVLNPNSVSKFLQISKFEFSGSVNTALYAYPNRPQEPWQLQLSAKRFPALNSLPKFSPEGVTYVPTNTHNGVVFDVHRPPMTRAPNAGKKMPVFPSRKKQAAAVNSGGLPLVPPQPDKEELKEAAATMNLRTAVQCLNEAKALHKDNLIMSLNEDNTKLSVFLNVDHE